MVIVGQNFVVFRFQKSILLSELQIILLKTLFVSALSEIDVFFNVGELGFSENQLVDESKFFLVGFLDS